MCAFIHRLVHASARTCVENGRPCRVHPERDHHEHLFHPFHLLGPTLAAGFGLENSHCRRNKDVIALVGIEDELIDDR